MMSPVYERVSLTSAFTNVEPFRSTLLRMLLPSEISSLLSALNCSVTEWERSTHMDLMHEIFEDIKELRMILDLGLTVQIFGSDLEKLKARIDHPSARSYVVDGGFHIFILISDRQSRRGLSTLHKDFRHMACGDRAMEDMSYTQLHNCFPTKIADKIVALSKWMLCTPHLAGSLPITVPGWIPMFNTRRCVSLRTYFSSYHEHSTKILHMNRDLFRQVFGCTHNTNMLAHLPDLTTFVYLLQGTEKSEATLGVRWSMNSLRDVYIPAREPTSEGFVIINTIHPLNSAITLTLP